jgi:ABC-type transporter Mla MlaB component
MKKKSDKSVTTETLTLIGDLTIEHVQELHQKLMAALDKTQHLTITFADVTGADLSCVQLLCSAHRTAVRTDKFLKLDQQRPEALCRVVKETGFHRDKGCALDSQGSCIWKEGWT